MTICRPGYMYHGFSPYVVKERYFLWICGANETLRVVMLKQGCCFQSFRETERLDSSLKTMDW